MKRLWCESQQVHDPSPFLGTVGAQRQYTAYDLETHMVQTPLDVVQLLALTVQFYEGILPSVHGLVSYLPESEE